MTEITTSTVLDLREKIVARGGNATAVKVRKIAGSVYQYSGSRGQGFANPVADIKPSAIATFAARDRALTLEEVGMFFRAIQNLSGFPNVKMGVKLVLLTLVRKTELIKALWEEIDFMHCRWTVPAKRII